MTAQPLGRTMTMERTVTPPDQVRALCWSAWGLEGTLRALPSERDEIFHVIAKDGRQFTLKLTSPAEEDIATDFQTGALCHAATNAPDLPIPHLVPDRKGRVAFRPDWPGDAVPTARLLTWLEGIPLAEAPRSPEQAASMGEALARLGIALADFDHAGADHDLAWDLRNTGRARALLPAIENGERRALVEAAMDRFEDVTAPRLETLRRQVIHNDLNPHNILVAADAPHLLTGIIDFGDLVRTALASDVAIAASYLLEEGDAPLRLPLALTRAYDAIRPLGDEEVALLAPLMEARLLMTVAITEWRAARQPENRAYITKNTGTAWRGLTLFASRPAAGWVDAMIDAHSKGRN